MAELDELSRLQSANEEAIAKKLLSINFKLEDIVTATGARVIIVTGCINVLVPRVSDTFQ